MLGGRRWRRSGTAIVHGGDRFAGPVRVDDAVLADMEALAPLAPLHQPHNLAAIRAVCAGPARPAAGRLLRHRVPPHAARASPAAAPCRDRLGLRRYGFHGLSYEYIAGQLAAAPGRPAGSIVAHLGNGASLCALRAGRSVETTMGTTPLDGLVMGTRCGASTPAWCCTCCRSGA